METNLANRMLKLKETRASLQRQLAQAEAAVQLHTERLQKEYGIADVAATEARIRQLKKKASQYTTSLEALEDKASELLDALEGADAR